MSKQVSQETIAVCDGCGAKAQYGIACDSCAKDFCFECGRTKVKEYPHSVHCSGSGDARYCIECDQRLAREGDKRQAKYLVIERLRNESKAYWDDFKRRADAAEQAIKDLP